MVFQFFLQSSFAVVKESTGVETEIESCSKTATEETEDQTDLNVSTGSLPALSEDDDEVDQDEESLHEPFANSTFATSEIKESTAVRKSPSILKRKRSSIDPNEAKKRKGNHFWTISDQNFRVPYCSPPLGYFYPFSRLMMHVNFR